MSQSISAADWADSRGDKWLRQLPGMEATLKPVDEPLIQALHLDKPYRIADIGCGGGGTTLALHHQAPAGSVVDGYDIASGLIDVARRRADDADAPIVFEVADLATEPPPIAPYDRLVARFSTMFFGDPQAAFANVLPWLRPGGRFAFAVWGPLADNPWFTHLRNSVAEVIAVPAPAPDAPGPFRYAEVDTLLALLGQAGFADLQVSDWRGLLPVGGGLSAPEAAKFALAALGTFGELLAQAGDAALIEARQLLTACYAQYLQDGIVQPDARVHIVAGTRP